MIVSEVSPWSSGNSPYQADWFELTNRGSGAVDLTGWKVDDSSNAVVGAVALSGVSSLEAGESAVFVNGDSSDASAFTSFWFGATVPAGLQVGTYDGSGIGLSTDGDAVVVFDAAGQTVTGISFGLSTTGRTFDNAAGAGTTAAPFPAVATLSAVGVDGAFQAGSEIGSPGSIENGSQPPAAHAVFTVPTFAQQAQGTIGAAQAVVVANDGTAALAVSRVRINDADGLSEGDFLVANESCTDAPIAPGSSCKVWVRFAPGRANATSNATLVLRDDTAAGSSTTALTATSGGLPQGREGPQGEEGAGGAQGPRWADGPDRSDRPDRAAGLGRQQTARTAEQRQGRRAPGPQGPAGAKGEKGDRGAAGRDAKVTCRVVTRRGAQRVTCSITLVEGRSAKAVKASAAARLLRNGTTVATGRLGALRATKTVKRGGSYTLRVAGLCGRRPPAVAHRPTPAPRQQWRGAASASAPPPPRPRTKA